MKQEEENSSAISLASFLFVNHKAAAIGSHDKPVLSVATHESYVYSASEDTTIRMWDRRMPGNVCDKKRVSLCVCVCVCVYCENRNKMFVQRNITS